jgi:CRP-like cAMP-binding protein
MGCGASAEKDNGKSNQKKKAGDVNRDYMDVMTFLEKVALMKRLPKDQYPVVAANLVAQDFKPNETIIKQGDDGQEFFVIRSGEAKVTVDADGTSTVVATLKAGDYFGENALLRDEKRTATITAVTAMKTMKLSRAKFQELDLHTKLLFANRKAVGAGVKEKAIAKEPTPKTEDDKKLIADAFRANKNLSAMVQLDDAKLQALIDVAWRENVKAGEALITEGDLSADYFYVCDSGSFKVTVADEEDSNGNGNGQKSAEQLASQGSVVKEYSKGGSFGELALLYLVPRAATVTAKEDSAVWVIDRTNFKKELMKVSNNKIAEYIKYLDHVEVLHSLLAEEKEAVAKALVEMHFSKGDIVLQQGEKGNTFYILYEGEVNIIKDNVQVTSLAASVSRGKTQFFGEKALLESEGRAATVQVASETAKALVLDRDSFNMLLGPLKDIMEKSQQTGTKRPSMTGGMKGLPENGGKPAGGDKIMRKDLVRIGMLGCGGFGTVELYEHKKSGQTFAMKGMSKGYIVKTGMQESVMNEKNILMMTNSKFIIKLYETYNGVQSLYFLMEPALGGELYATYNRKGFHGSARHAKFYAAGVVLAFEHLHERRIVYRDLKPENLLLNELGKLKLTDMGLAKFAIGKTYTTCGTPDYFAPELIASSGHTNALDWWTLGILIFEMMSGHPPFESAYPMQIYSKVIKGINKVPMPTKCQGSVAELIKALLKNDPSERLPMLAGGIKNVKNHSWFETFDWEAMENCTLEPPYKPVVKSKKDLANFSARKEDMPTQLHYTDDGSGWDKGFATA